MRRVPLSAFGLVLVLGAPAAQATPLFMGLGNLIGIPGFPSDARGISADGSTAVGTSCCAFQAFRWTQGTGMVGLGDLAGSTFNSGAQDVSADGSVVVGGGRSATGPEAFRWTQADGMVGLGDLAGGIFSSGAGGVSADGSVVIGLGSSASGVEAFRWTQADGMVGLGDLAGGAFESRAFDVSADGSVVVGAGAPAAASFEAFRWTEVGGMTSLGLLPGGTFSSADGVSADGSIVVGRANSASGPEAFIWDAAHGMRQLDRILTNLGVDLTGWALSEASDISADGRAIVGHGPSPNAVLEAWLVVLDHPVPEPPTELLLALGLGALAARRRCQR